MNGPRIRLWTEDFKPASHIVTLQRHRCRFGDTWQAVCELGCNYVGPFVSHARAQAIAEEHRRKSAGTWRATR